MVWWPFAPKPERADTLEVTDLHSGAPPLYSTFFVVRIFTCGIFTQTRKRSSAFAADLFQKLFPAFELLLVFVGGNSVVRAPAFEAQVL